MNQLGIADGSILLGRGEKRDEVARLAQEGFPFVYIGRREIEGASISWVTADYSTATQQVVERLAGLGHRRLLYLGVERPEEPNLDRFDGWERACREQRMQPALLRPAPDEDLARVMQDQIDRGITGIVVETPDDAGRVFRAAKALDLAVPEDLSIAVLGDMSVPRARKRSWSGFWMPYKEIGAEAVRLLVELITDPGATARTVRLPCHPHEGRTVAPPATRRP